MAAPFVPVDDPFPLSVSLRSFPSMGELLLPSSDKPPRVLFGVLLFSPLPRFGALRMA